MRFSGLPHRPKPPLISVAPSGCRRPPRRRLAKTLFMLVSPISARPSARCPRRRRCRATPRRASCPGPSSSCSSVTSTRAPEAPMGWPSDHRAAAHVHLRRVQLEELVVGDGDHREGLVDLPEVDVVRLEASSCSSSLLMASAGAMVNSTGLRAACGVAGDAAEDRPALRLGALRAHQHQRRRAVVDRRGVGGGDGAVLLEDRLEARRSCPAWRSSGPRRRRRSRGRPSSGAPAPGRSPP